MSYLSRAESMVDRGQTMRAFFVLVNGLRQNPNDEHALNLLVDLYIRDIDSPGVETELLQVLQVVPNGLDIYEMIHASLEQSGDDRRLKSLLQHRERQGLLPDLPAPPPPLEHAPHLAEFDTPTAGRESRVQRVAPPQPIAGYPMDDGRHAHQGFGMLNAPIAETTPQGDLDWLAPPPSSRRPQPMPPPAMDVSTALVDDSEDASQETATTGMFSSINAYLSDQHRVVNEELALRSKRRLLWVGVGVLLLIVLLLVLTSNQGGEASSVEVTNEPAPEGPVITEPIPADE